jgi:Zn-dependent protease with chaperone function
VRAGLPLFVLVAAGFAASAPPALGAEVALTIVSDPAGASLVTVGARSTSISLPTILRVSVPAHWTACAQSPGITVRWPDGTLVVVGRLELCPDGGLTQDIRVEKPDLPLLTNATLPPASVPCFGPGIAYKPIKPGNCERSLSRPSTDPRRDARTVPRAGPSEAPRRPSREPGTPRPTPRLVTKPETIHGYAEWQRPAEVIVDGQRVVWDAGTKWDRAKFANPGTIPLGYEVTAVGSRDGSGALLASRISGKTNGRAAAFEDQATAAQNYVEARWLSAAEMREPGPDGSSRVVGRVLTTGIEVERARSILFRVLPPYVDRAGIRVYVVDTAVWNAKAMSNGSVWVFKGLLNDVTDDELAAVLGHEAVHYTHEHSRRLYRTAAIADLINVWARYSIAETRNASAAELLDLGRVLGLSAWAKGYSRDLEDQADRVGLRYAFEGGYDVTAASRMWRRVLTREGQPDVVSNFFLGDHSRSSDRIRNIDQQIRLNYSVLR